MCECFNISVSLKQCDKYPAVVDENYLLLLGIHSIKYLVLYEPSVLTDTRSSEDYNEGHVQLAKLARKCDDSSYRVPFGAHLPTCLHCVVYDSKTVSVIEDSECKLNTHTLTRTHTLVCYCSSSYSTGKPVGS